MTDIKHCQKCTMQFHTGSFKRILDFETCPDCGLVFSHGSQDKTGIIECVVHPDSVDKLACGKYVPPLSTPQ